MSLRLGNVSIPIHRTELACKCCYCDSNGAALKSLLLSAKNVVNNLLVNERPVLKSLLMDNGTELKSLLMHNATASE
jgi:hypothetical protein